MAIFIKYVYDVVSLRDGSFFEKKLPHSSTGVIGFLAQITLEHEIKAGFCKTGDRSVNGTVSLSTRLESSTAPVETLTVGTCIIWNASMKTAQPIHSGEGG